MKAYWGSGGIAPHILNLTIRLLTCQDTHNIPLQLSLLLIPP
jgi:hypothetical protein